MLRTDQFRKKLKIEIDGEPWMMLDVEHVRPGKGQGFTRTKLKNMVNGTVLERTYKSNETVMPATVDDVEMQFLYQSGDDYTFMNNESFEQMNITAETLGDTALYLYENMNVTVSIYKDMPISVDVPNFVEMEITECEPGVKGNSANNKMKPAVLESGLRVNVPLFVEQNEWIRVDTRTGDYVERCKKPDDR